MGGVRDWAVDGASFVQKWAISAIVSVAECKSPFFVGGSDFCVAGCSYRCWDVRGDRRRGGRLSGGGCDNSPEEVSDRLL